MPSAGIASVQQNEDLSDMVRLHLIGFTTDLKNLIFATRKGAKSGGYIVSIDPRLRNTLQEVAKLEEEAGNAPKKSGKQKAEPKPRSDAKLSPKEIQTLLRKGKTAQQVAKLADTNIEWVKRFESPILAERLGVIDSVRASTISKARLGNSGVSVGEAIAANLRDKRVELDEDQYEDSWNAVRRDGYWQVAFTYQSRGKRKQARFAYDPEVKEARALNTVALDLGWRSQNGPKPRPKTPRTKPSSKPRRSVTRSRTRRKPTAKSKARPTRR
ncbi:MAG TPA: septation protein SepH [Actinomycetota bacterium]|nr:septation protein SepH [Actinomycetota bacterium]